ncbi:MAG: hypothetical protein HC941_01770 [Microcoleus sp. SU_5_3]|nr:hypothetical protein [Microcoleus sp. SU_5_3]
MLAHLQGRSHLLQVLAELALQGRFVGAAPPCPPRMARSKVEGRSAVGGARNVDFGSTRNCRRGGYAGSSVWCRGR